MLLTVVRLLTARSQMACMPAVDKEKPVLSLTVTLGVAELAAVVILVFIVAVKSPLVGALVKLVTVVIVPAVMLVGVAKPV